VLSYVNAGYSGSHWSGTTLLNTFSGLPVGLTTAGFNRNGVFVGGGVENNLNIFGISAPGWFMKTEYRAAYYDRKTINETFANGALFGDSMTFKPLVQTISTSLVYRFNWSGPLVAKY
jgi:outer membrane immunogenic protein